MPANGVAAIISAAASAASQQAATIAAADESVRTSRQTVDRLTRVVQSGAATEQQISQLASARSTFASAHASRSSALDAVFAAASAVMNQSQRRIATNIRANHAWGLAVHHRAAENMTEVQWVALRDAIGYQDGCSRLGEEVPSAATAAIAESESVTDVAAAKSSHASNAGTVATAWNQAVAGG